MRQLPERRSRIAPFTSGDDGHELLDLGFLHAFVDDDALDAELLEATHQLAHRLGRSRDRHFADDELFADDADGDRWRRLMNQREGVDERSRAARDEGMAGRVELRSTDCRREATREFVGQTRALRHTHVVLFSRFGNCATCARAILRTARPPLLAAASSTARASGVPSLRRDVAAACRCVDCSKWCPPAPPQQDLLERANRFRPRSHHTQRLDHRDVNADEFSFRLALGEDIAEKRHRFVIAEAEQLPQRAFARRIGFEQQPVQN